jgi:minichromosome maintenance protein 10
MCSVVKRDGKPCGSWCDKRVSDVCDYHVQTCRRASPRRAARVLRGVRLLLSSSATSPVSSQTLTRQTNKKSRTSGLGVGSSLQKRKAAYDPQRKWGLSPAEGSVAPPTDATYIVAGHVVAGAGSSKRDLFLSESVGREAQTKAARQANSRDTDAALKLLLKRDKAGMQAVQAARAFAKNGPKKEAKAPGRDGGPSLRKRRRGR